MIHLYCGDGKGKTSAACGLAVRAAGSGQRVLFAQFLKDGASSELSVLSSIPGITLLTPRFDGWFGSLAAQEKDELKERYRALIGEIADAVPAYDVLILDEAVVAYRFGLFDNDVFLDLLRAQRDYREIVLTGRDPAPELCDLADYITEMKKQKHPFDKGVAARKGIEY